MPKTFRLQKINRTAVVLFCPYLVAIPVLRWRLNKMRCKIPSIPSSTVMLKTMLVWLNIF